MKQTSSRRLTRENWASSGGRMPRTHGFILCLTRSDSSPCAGYNQVRKHWWWEKKRKPQGAREGIPGHRSGSLLFINFLPASCSKQFLHRYLHLSIALSTTRNNYYSFQVQSCSILCRTWSFPSFYKHRHKNSPQSITWRLSSSES